jgi:primosomal protein N' (replication factor Y) (superfamily II helicase)
MSQFIASVAVSNTTRDFDRHYHYIIPERLINLVKPGIRVVVPFGSKNRQREAYVLEILECLDSSKLKKICSVVDACPLITAEMLKHAAWMKKRYICTYSDAIRCMLPPDTRAKSQKAAFLTVPPDMVRNQIDCGGIKTIQQIRVLEILLENECIPVADILGISGVSRGVMDTLKKNGFIDFKNINIDRSPFTGKEIMKTYPLKLTPMQKPILDGINEIIDRHEFEEVLLHGVTGSGKTEIYLQLIGRVVKEGRQAIVLVPEIALTPQMVERFKARFTDEVAVLHSRLSEGERYDQWGLIKKGAIKVVVGARSAVFAPLERIGIIIIDEEHENSYKSETTPKYHAAEIAMQRCGYNNAVLVYGSATPSINTSCRALNGEIKLFRLSDRVNNMQLPSVHIADMREELANGNRSIFSRILKEEIERNISLKQQTILFLNRRGYSSFVLCRSCGYTLKCESCSVSLTYHASDERLICHYCGNASRMPEVCPRCKSSYIRQFGTGTQKVEEEVLKAFPGCTTIRMDADTTGYKNSHEQLLTKFREKNINILIGTQMVAKGHDFPNVTLVGILAADSLLNIGDYRASERAFQLLTQAAGRAGRDALEGRVVIQTYNTDDFSIQAAVTHDYESFYKQEIKVRESLGYPPYKNISTVVLSGLNDRTVRAEANYIMTQIRNRFEALHGPVELLGPVRAPVQKIKNRYRWRIVIKCADMEKLTDVLTCISDTCYKKVSKNGVELGVDINPVNML